MQLPMGRWTAGADGYKRPRLSTKDEKQISNATIQVKEFEHHEEILLAYHEACYIHKTACLVEGLGPGEFAA